MAILKCEVPHCGRKIFPDDNDGYPQGNYSRGLCSRCNASRYYWNKKSNKDPKAVLKRKQTMQFWSDRLTWLFK